MYVCICKNITDRQIRHAVQERDIRNVRDLRACLGACTQCGKCARDAQDIIRDTLLAKNCPSSINALAA